MSFSVNKDVLMKCLRRAHPDAAITIEEHKFAQYDVEPGTNNTSEIFGVSVEFLLDGKRQKEFLVFKVPFLSANFESLRKTGLYEQETYMYATVLPKMAKILNLSMVPKHYDTTESNVLVLEDLCSRGYYMVDRSAATFEQSALVFENLAEFHACSVKFDRLYPNSLSPVADETLYTKSLVDDTLAVALPILLKVLQRERVDAKSIRRLSSYAEEMKLTNICEIANRSCHFNVLNHGKLKTNNVLLKNDSSGKPVAVKLIDFQTCRWNSPVLDLIYFCMISMDFETFESQYEVLLDRYLASLNGSLRKLECDQAYTKENHNSDLAGSKLYEIFTLFWVGFLDIRGTIEGFSHECTIEWDEEKIEKICRSELFRKNFMKWFGHFERKGYFK